MARRAASEPTPWITGPVKWAAVRGFRFAGACARLSWRFVTQVARATGILGAILVGLLLMALAVLVSLTGIGLVVGLPLGALGFLLVVRGLF